MGRASESNFSQLPLRKSLVLMIKTITPPMSTITSRPKTMVMLLLNYSAESSAEEEDLMMTYSNPHQFQSRRVREMQGKPIILHHINPLIATIS
jgi:malic enzyme